MGQNDPPPKKIPKKQKESEKKNLETSNIFYKTFHLCTYITSKHHLKNFFLIKEWNDCYFKLKYCIVSGFLLTGEMKA